VSNTCIPRPARAKQLAEQSTSDPKFEGSSPAASSPKRQIAKKIKLHQKVFIVLSTVLENKNKRSRQSHLFNFNQ
jgi:hypothetical protein